MAIDQEASRCWRSRLPHGLNMDWDPVGLRAGPDDDEYEHHVGKVAALLREGVSDDALFAYLNWPETENMGLSGNPARLKKVIAAI